MDTLENILYTRAEALAYARAKRIDNAFKSVMPEWQWKLMLKTKSKFLAKLLGYEIRYFIGSNKFEIWRRGKREV